MRPGVRLGVDVGTVRVGLASCDPRGILATPVATVTRAEDGSDLDVIADQVHQLGAIEVVVGLPMTLRGTEGPASGAARKYAEALATRIAPIPVRLVDERLSTVDAHRSLRESEVAGRHRRAVVDQVAAVLILQTALDAERATGTPAGALARRRRKPRADKERA